jgi:hypothetical protein
MIRHCCSGFRVSSSELAERVLNPFHKFRTGFQVLDLYPPTTK